MAQANTYPARTLANIYGEDGAGNFGKATASIFTAANGCRVIGDNTSPTVDLVINDVNADGYIEARLEGSTTSFFANYFQVASGLGFIELWKPTGAAIIDISPKPNDGSSATQLSLFRNANTTGRADVIVYKGDGTNTINAVISGKGDSYVNLQTAGEFGVGTDTPAAKLHVHTAGSTEKARFTRLDLTYGLSLGYDDSGSTSAYIYNRYASGTSAIHFGTGTDFSASRLMTLALGGLITIRPGSSVTPANNGDVMFELTSNTSLTFKAKGSDGTVRSGSVTLS